MTRLSAKDFQPEVLQLFDRYVHGGISRRGFLDRAATLAGSAAAAAGLLAALNPQFAQAQQVAPGDARLQTRYQVFEAPDGNGAVRGYLAKPAGVNGKLPAVLVIHENRGLNPHIEDITRELFAKLDAGVAFYGSQPPLHDVPAIRAPLLLHYAGIDDRINAGWPKYEAALRAAGTRYEAFLYAGKQHGFNNDTTPRFDADAAKLAWLRTTAFFRKHLT